MLQSGTKYFSPKNSSQVFKFRGTKLYHLCTNLLGGPLVCNVNGGATIYGIVSRMTYRYCNFTDNTAIYTNVYHFAEDIEKLIVGSEDQEDFCPVGNVSYRDGLCDSFLNTPENCFDGGDCCGTEIHKDHITKCEYFLKYYGFDVKRDKYLCNCQKQSSLDMEEKIALMEELVVKWE